MGYVVFQLNLGLVKKRGLKRLTDFDYRYSYRVAWVAKRGLVP